MKQIIEKLKEQADDIFVNRLDPEAASWGMQEGVLISANEARQIVEALEGKGCTTDELKKAFIAGSKFGAERFGSTAGWLGAKLENPDFDEWIATVKPDNEIKTETNWISVDDRLPENENNVLAVLDGQTCIMSYFDFQENGETFKVWGYVYDGINGDGEYDDNYNPTHWQPLPTPPKH